ncbi:MAG: FlgD immunoglobulin-like domain containing protein [Candidatus Krumholzibacteriia bacterium]
MRHHNPLLIPCLAVLLSAVAAPAGAALPVRNDIIFIHHSIGRGLIDPYTAAARDSLKVWNAANGTQVVLWDHDYGPDHPIWGLSDPQGINLGYGYGEEFNNTIQVAGYRALFCTDNAARDSLLANHTIIAFKPGYESGWLYLLSDAELDSAKADYLAMRDFFDQHPDRLFIVVTQPPLHRNAPYLDARKDRARALARWLRSPEYLGGRQNLATFDLFDLLATRDDPRDPYCNTLKYEYELDHTNSDPHPNDFADTVVGPQFALFIYRAATLGRPVDVPAAPPAIRLETARPNPFNPRTELAFVLGAAAHVRLTLHDARGRLVAVLTDADRAAGRHAVIWNGTDARGRPAPSGAYFARLRVGGETRVGRLVLAR